MNVDLDIFSDGYVAFVKEDCPTCLLIEPVLSRLAELGQLNAVFSQDNKDFPALGITIDDSDLRLSFQHGIETCLLYTSPSPRDGLLSRMPSSA